ncbi:MAG: protein kinase, partial [Acidobacteriota bacterium]
MHPIKTSDLVQEITGKTYPARGFPEAGRLWYSCATMSLQAGTRIGPYEITGRLGTGGMGEVYRATDTRLRREVAIKALPEELVGDPERLTRFRREAQILASLNHANIAAIHGLEEIDGKPFLALELVEGEDLAEKAGAGPMPLGDALSIAGQIAEALEEAHENGIIHRDLKPANVRVTRDGKVKVLDFGLAKALQKDAAGGGGSEGELSQSPTLAGTMGTHAGVILGTAAYMAPEQARGKPVDKRADIWAFGVVLYEMLTGKRVFGGETISDRLAAVLTRAPDLDALPQAVPAVIRNLLARCLDKDPRSRLRDIGEARYLIHEVLAAGSGPDMDREKTAPATRRTRSMARVAGAGIVFSLVLAGGIFLGRQWGARSAASPGSSAVRFNIAGPGEVDAIWNPALAADGSFVVFEGWSRGSSELFLHRFDSGVSRSIPGTEGARMPFISPDGRWIGYRQAGMLKKVGVAGGDSLRIGEVPMNFPGAVWLPDGRILFTRGWLDGLWEISAEGGQPRPLTRIDVARGEKGHWWPHPLPGGQAVLFTIFRAKAGLNDASVAVLDTATGKYRHLFAGADPWFLPPGHIVYSRAGAYHAVAFDPVSLEVTGDPVPVLDDATNLYPAGDWHMPLSVASNQTVVYVTRKVFPRARLVWLTAGKDPEYLPFPARSYFDLDLSPDGRWLAVSSQEDGTMVIRILDVRQGTEERPS